MASGRLTIDERAAANRVIGYWVARRVAARRSVPLASMTGRPDNKFVRMIADRMRDGFTEFQCLRSVDGCFLSEWHMGKNKEDRVYDNLSTIFYTSEKVQRFIDIADSASKRGSMAYPEAVNGNGRTEVGQETSTYRDRQRARRAALSMLTAEPKEVEPSFLSMLEREIDES